jgi:hypothetical protein
VLLLGSAGLTQLLTSPPCNASSAASMPREIYIHIPSGRSLSWPSALGFETGLGLCRLSPQGTQPSLTHLSPDRDPSSSRPLWSGRA